MSRCLSIHGHIKDPFAVCSSDIAYIIIVAVFGAVARHDRIFQVLVMQVRVDALRGSGLGGSLSSLIWNMPAEVTDRNWRSLGCREHTDSGAEMMISVFLFPPLLFRLLLPSTSLSRGTWEWRARVTVSLGSKYFCTVQWKHLIRRLSRAFRNVNLVGGDPGDHLFDTDALTRAELYFLSSLNFHFLVHHVPMRSVASHGLLPLWWQYRRSEQTFGTHRRRNWEWWQVPFSKKLWSWLSCRKLGYGCFLEREHALD